MIVNNRIIPGIGNIGNNNNSANNVEREHSVDFSEILSQQLNKNTEVKFSKHAMDRLESRDIHMTDEQKQKLNESVDKAAAKNVRDSLIMMDDLAFVVNVRNKTVVTVVNKEEMKENVFTNIDGAVIA